MGLTRRAFITGAATSAVLLAGTPIGARARAQEGAVSSSGVRPWFDAAFGARVAGDMPRAYDIGAGRTLWATNDSYLAPRSGAGLTGATFVRNAVFVELAQRLALTHPASKPFLAHDGSPFDRWWWFHGGIAVGDQLHVFVTRMRRTAAPGWAINFVYDETWIATVSTRDWQLTALCPAANSGIRPVYGFSVASDDRWTYLFGNNALYGEGTTDNFVARVPYGQVRSTPTYWDSRGWSTEPEAAASVHTAGSYAYRLHVFRHGQRWLATCKEDEFFGSELHVLEAARPTGPWRVIARRPLPTVTGDGRTCTDDAQAMTAADGSLRVWWSNNAFTEADVRADPSRYRPRSMTIDV